jgi:hypothetical protein
MRATTELHWLFESVGKPQNTQQGKGSVREALRAQVEWLDSVYMGSKIRVTLARSEADLFPAKSGGTSSMVSEFESMLDLIGEQWDTTKAEQ